MSVDKVVYVTDEHDFVIDFDGEFITFTLADDKGEELFTIDLEPSKLIKNLEDLGVFDDDIDDDIDNGIGDLELLDESEYDAFGAWGDE